MGLYDSINVTCPHCGSIFEAQSRAGDCILDVYTLDTAPPEILADLFKRGDYCDVCNKSVAFELVSALEIEPSKS